MQANATGQPGQRVHAISVFRAFLKLGCTSFGGPIAHIGYFRSEFVEKRRWLDDSAYTDLVALCNFLPEPASSQIGIALGTLKAGLPGGFLGGLLCLIAIFLPSFLLIIGALPFWDALRQKTHVQSALRGVSAAVVGLLLAALYDPLWTSSIRSTGDMALVLVLFGLLMFWKWSPLYVVALAVIGGAVKGLL